ncbi:MAG: MFS transporter [Halofilum sp. (in: g-proteobacteria)]|nr:MFS transporter [Halofilum sp. (in: g-proteobacteria)]
MDPVDLRYEGPAAVTYGLLAGEEPSDRVCDAIPDDQCTAVPGNYLRNLANGASTKLAEQLAGPNLVLPWLLAATGAPAAIIGLLAPVRQAGAMLPQLAFAAAVRRLPQRKWAWSGAATLQALCLLAMIPAALGLGGVAGGVAVVLLLAVFSIASGLGSVAFQDVMGKTIPKGQRGRLLGQRATIGGGLTVLAGAWLYLSLGAADGAGMYAALVGAAALLWVLGAMLFALIEEVPGATEGGRNAIDSVREGIGLWRAAPAFRRYLLARGLLVTVEIAAPFYALYARELFGGALSALGVYVLAVGVGNVVASPFWGRLADTSARRGLILAGAFAAAVAFLALLLGEPASGVTSPWAFALVFVGLGIAESGVRLGRKTWLVDAVGADDRPVYVAFANSTMGAVTLAWGALGLVAQAAGVPLLLGLLGGLALAGAIAAARMPEAHRFGG